MRTTIGYVSYKTLYLLAVFHDSPEYSEDLRTTSCISGGEDESDSLPDIRIESTNWLRLAELLSMKLS